MQMNLNEIKEEIENIRNNMSLMYDRLGQLFKQIESLDPRSPTLRTPVHVAIELLRRIREKVLTDDNYDGDDMVHEIDAVLKTAAGG